MMHDCDMFESGKQLAEYNIMTVSGTDDIKIDKLVEHIRKGFKEMDSNIVFISIRTINGKINTEYPAYIRKDTQTISNGKGFGMFCDMLRRIGYKVTTDEYMHVLTAVLETSND